MKVRRIASATCPFLYVIIFSNSFASAQSGGQPSLGAIRAACADDVQKLCAGVQSGGGRILACLKEHKDSLSDGCKQAAGVAVNPSSSSAPNGAGGLPSSGANTPASSRAALSRAVSARGVSPTAPGTSAGQKEKFVERVATDAEHEGMRAVTIHLPEKWHFESKIEWHYDWVEYPLAYSAQAENPENAEAYFQYPLLRFESVDVAPQLSQYNRGNKTKPGDRLPTGAIAYPPQPPLQSMAAFIQKVRPNVTNLKWIGQQELPDLAKELKLAPWPNQRGVAIKISYDLNGQPVEEAFFGVYYLSRAGTDAVRVGQMNMGAGMLRQTNWGFQALQSMRAPAGTLDRRMPMFCVIAKSMYINPEWARLLKAINDKMLTDFNQKLKQGYDQLRAADAIREQTMRDQAAFQANFDKQEAAFRNSPGVNDDFLHDRDGARSASDHWSDLIRGVDTVNDPSTGGTTQLSNLGQYHFTDGFGNYRTYDNPNDTPENHNEVGSWQLMTPAN